MSTHDASSRAQVRKVRLWILAVTGVSLGLIFAWGWVMSSSSDLTRADAEACALLDQGVSEIRAGRTPGEALDGALQGWPAGFPSDSVRGVFNAFHQAIATEQDRLSGLATDGEYLADLDYAMAGYQQVCR